MYARAKSMCVCVCVCARVCVFAREILAPDGDRPHNSPDRIY